MKEIFVITACETIQMDHGRHGRLGFGCTRAVGWYDTLAEATAAVCENRLDIHECFYDYVFVESSPIGLYKQGDIRKLYKWNVEEKCYKEIAIPDFLEHFGCLSIG